MCIVSLSHNSMRDNTGMWKVESTSMFIGNSPVTPIQRRGSELFRNLPFFETWKTNRKTEIRFPRQWKDAEKHKKTWKLETDASFR